MASTAPFRAETITWLQIIIAASTILALTTGAGKGQSSHVLQPDALRRRVAQFNSDDGELYRQHIPNIQAQAFLEQSIPLFECPDRKRATINSYMYGDAMGIAKIASPAGRQEIAQQFREKAERIKTLVQSKLRDRHVVFYIGFRDEHRGQIGLARSRDGITGWQRHPANPIISPVEGAVSNRSAWRCIPAIPSAFLRWRSKGDCYATT